MTEDKYVIKGYKLNVPILRQVKLTHRDQELVRKLDALRRVPREEIAKVFNVSTDEIYRVLRPRQAFNPSLPALTTERRRKATDLILDGESNTEVAKLTGLTAATVRQIRVSLRPRGKDDL